MRNVHARMCVCVCVKALTIAKGFWNIDKHLLYSCRGLREPNWDQSQRRRPVSAREARMDASLCTCFFTEWQQAKPRTCTGMLLCVSNYCTPMDTHVVAKAVGPTGISAISPCVGLVASRRGLRLGARQYFALRNNQVTGEHVSKSKWLHLGPAVSLSLQVPPHVCANTNLIALSNESSGLSATPRLAEAVFCCKHRDHRNCRIPLQHGFNLRVSGAYFPHPHCTWGRRASWRMRARKLSFSLHLGPSRQLVDEK